MTVKSKIYLNKSIDFEKVFHQFYSPLSNYAFKILGDKSTAEDVVQNLFIQLWENKKLEEVENVERFLIRATKFKCLDYLKTKRVNTEVFLEKLPEIIQLENNEMSEEDIEPLLHYFTAKLPPKTRKVFLLSRKNGLTYKEIAKELAVSVKTVENQMGSALKKMRELLKENEYLSLLLFLGLN